MPEEYVEVTEEQLRRQQEAQQRQSEYIQVEDRIPEKELEILNKMISPSTKTARRGNTMLPFIEQFTQDLTTANLTPQDRNFIDLLLDIAQNLQFISMQVGINEDNELLFDLTEATNFFVNQAMTSALSSKSINGFMVRQWRTQYGVSDITQKSYQSQLKEKGKGWFNLPFKSKQ